MDLNGDGHIDVLSGSYSRMEKDMAGLYQVLWGTAGGALEKAAVLNGTNSEPLLMPPALDAKTDKNIVKICTRPFACDLNGDGKLDLVSGNFDGTFAFFVGVGNGRFSPQATWLTAGSELMRVNSHSDPFLVDFDGDGDLDLLSGSAEGGVFLFRNDGTRTEPKFAAKQTLLAAAGHALDDAAHLHFGDAHCVAPAADTRIWVDDVDGDGKLDILVGDQIGLCYPLEGVSEAAARKDLAAWTEQQQALFRGERGDDEASQKRFQDAYEKLDAKRKQIVTDVATGFVWLLRQK